MLSNMQNTGHKKHMVLHSIRRSTVGWLMLLPALICFIVFSWEPLISGASLSLFRTVGFNAEEFVGLQNYISVINDSLFLTALKNSCVYTLWSFAIGFFFPIICALMINEIIRGKTFFRTAVYFPGMVPGVAAALMWKLMYDPGQGGLLNMFRGVFGLQASQWLQDPSLTIPLLIIKMTWSGFGGTTILYLAALQGVNTDLYEASSLDGAGIFRKIWNVTLPEISGMIKLFAVMQFMGVFQMFMEPFLMTGGGPNNASMSLGLVSYNYAFNYFRVDKSTALSMITTMILIIFTVIYYRIGREKNA